MKNKFKNLPKKARITIQESENFFYFFNQSDSEFNSDLIFIVDSKNCNANINLKIVTRENVILNLQTKLVLSPNAGGSEVFLDIKCLVLGKNNLVNISPNLEINIDDVRASHGASVGEIEHTYIDFMFSRGLNKLLAEKLFLEKFFK